MAVWLFKCYIQLLIVSRLASFLYARDSVDHSTSIAQVPTSWTNNDATAFSLTKHYLGFQRFILFQMTSRIRGFACGFLSNGATNLSVFAIVTLHINLYYNESYFELDVVWMANRNRLIAENGTLELLQDGDLVLKDTDGTTVWSTNTSNKSVVGMRIMETGNLVLYDTHNRTVWQSFDHPTDTLLNGQKLVDGQKLVAGTSDANWTEGNYFFTVTPRGFFGFYQSSAPVMFFKFTVSGDRESLETSYVKAKNGTLALYISSTEPADPNAILSTPSKMKYMKLEPDGHIRVYMEDAYLEPVDVLADVLTECAYPTICGTMELCSNGRCSCPGGYFKANSSNDSGGCVEISPATCGHSHDFLQLSDVYYFNYVDDNAAVLQGTDVESCKQACSKNCSCKAALFRYFYNLSHGNCFLPSPILSLMADVKRWNTYQSAAFLKTPNHLPEETKSSSPASKKWIIVGSVTGALILIATAVTVLNAALKKTKSNEENGEDYLDQMSGMPIRFSYEELKLATGDFSQKLGEGGFGSVYEGTLSDGQKVAVKRLDGLGQGKKEFLAEVKTIGSIHHVNLVRLIGFCAEKLDRLLVYEFMSNGSLDKWIFRRSLDQMDLDWQTRRNIIHDIAKGLAYLHEECRQRIVHLDIKPQNILLDANFCAKVSDFGLSKLIDKDQSQIVTTLRGTPGYLAPEWLSSYITEKADVYSFGIVVMEMTCGRKNLDKFQSEEEYQPLLPLFMKCAEENQLHVLVDNHNIDMQLHAIEVIRVMSLAVWCLQSNFTRRPSMSTVVKVLEGTMDVESNLNYTFQNLKNAPVKSATATIVRPSILSGPR